MSKESDIARMGYDTPYNTLVNDDGDVVIPDSYDTGKPDPSFVYTQARRTGDFFTQTVPLIELDDPTEHDRMVSIADRALALTAIMKYLNKKNQANGSALQLVDPESDFNKRYSSYPDQAYDVQEGVEAKVENLFDGYVWGIHTLHGTAAMEKSGVDEDSRRDSVIAFKRTINDEFLAPGKAMVKKRAAAVKSATKLAQAVTNQPKTPSLKQAS